MMFISNIHDGPTIDEVINCYSLYYDCNDSGQSTSLFGDLMYTNHNVYYVASMFGSALCAGYVIAITLSIAISREIKRLKTLCSKKTIELQNRLLRALILQATLPAIFLIIPVVVIAVTITLNGFSPLVNGFSVGFMSYVTVVSALIDLFTITHYRRMLHPKSLLTSVQRCHRWLLWTIAPKARLLDAKESVFKQRCASTLVKACKVNDGRVSPARKEARY
ncbi:hypothetical protein Tcan_16153 [Toxocara canis]|uniref:G protein-coupled receptor n=1 Tax=Toxocara canis TaxID=6265 RepID=A0A0B2VU84_TOXCA|nr:hypothetical protein Tcan_16153 [Toxocara canis]